MMSGPKLDELSINTIRFLSVDAVQQANSSPAGDFKDFVPTWPVTRLR